MAKVLVLYYSSYGHIETMAKAVAEGAKGAGADVTIKRVPELVPEDVAKKSGMKLDQDAPVARPDELGEYDAIIFGAPTRFGTVASQMRNFMDQTGGLWMKGALVGKVGSVFTTDLYYSGDPDYWRRWAQLGVLCVDMETAGLYSYAAKFGVQALSIFSVEESLVTGEKSSQSEQNRQLDKLAELALGLLV